MSLSCSAQRQVEEEDAIEAEAVDGLFEALGADEHGGEVGQAEHIGVFE